MSHFSMDVSGFEHPQPVSALWDQVKISTDKERRQTLVDNLVEGFESQAKAQNLVLSHLTDLSEVQQKYSLHTLVRVEDGKKVLDLMAGEALVISGEAATKGLANAASMEGNTDWARIAFGEARVEKGVAFMIGFDETKVESKRVSPAVGEQGVVRPDRQFTRSVQGFLTLPELRFILIRIPSVNASDALLEKFGAERWDPKTRNIEAPQFLYILADTRNVKSIGDKVI